MLSPRRSAVYAFLLSAAFALAGPRIAVVDLQNRTGDASLDGAGAGISGVLVSKLVNVDELEVVERDRLEAVLGEIGLGKGGAVDPATAAKAGKLLGATHLVTGDLVSVKLPTVAINLRVVEVSSGKVIAATDVVGQVGDHGEEFFVLVDDATFRIVDALQVKLAAKDRIELGQVEVKQLSTVEAYGRALSALDRGDSASAQVELAKALAVEPGFTLAESTLARLAGQIAAAKQEYASAAITRVHESWAKLEAAVAGDLPDSPTPADLAHAAIRARMRYVRGDFEGYLRLDRARVEKTTVLSQKDESAFSMEVRRLATDPWVYSRTLSGLTAWPHEARLQEAEVLVLLGRTDEAGKVLVGNYQHPGPTFSYTVHPQYPSEWASRHGLFDLAVIGRQQLLEQAQLRGNAHDIKDALRRLDEAVKEATEAHATLARWQAVAARVGKEAATERLCEQERSALAALADDGVGVLAGYAAFRSRFKAGWYAPVVRSDAFAELAERWHSAMSGGYAPNFLVDQEVALELDEQEMVPSRDDTDTARRKKRLDELVAGLYGG